jgi:hypothetical protein
MANPELTGSIEAIISGISFLIQRLEAIIEWEEKLTGYRSSPVHIAVPLR